VRELAAFVQLDERDAEAIRGSAPLVLRHETALTAAVYEHFLQHPMAARFFLGPDGAPDVERLERRKHSLARWLRETALVSLDTGDLYGLLGIGIAHSHRTHGPGGAIPPELVVGAMSLVQTALAQILLDELGDARAALAASMAWNKLLLLQLNVLLHGYFMAWREGDRPH
jgi:Protoglobin